jgi:hypothetical protein
MTEKLTLEEAAELLSRAARELMNDDEPASSDTLDEARRGLDGERWPYALEIVELAVEQASWRGCGAAGTRAVLEQTSAAFAGFAAALREFGYSQRVRDWAGRMPDNAVAAEIGRDYSLAGQRVACSLVRSTCEEAGLEVPGWALDLAGSRSPREEASR